MHNNNSKTENMNRQEMLKLCKICSNRKMNLSGIRIYKKIICLVLVIMASCEISINAQDYEDVIYLKNGSAIRGMIIEYVPGVSFKIQTYDGNIFVYDIAEIEKMTKEIPSVKLRKARMHYANNEFNKETGYLGHVEIGLAPGINGYSPFRVGATIINGYRVLPQFAVGVGVGLQFFTGYSELSLPIFAHLRSDFLNRNVSPFLAFNLGYNFSILGGYYGGLMMEPSAGVGFNMGNKYRMTVGLGMAIDKTKFYYGKNFYYDWAYAINIKLGLSF